ncbi:hypothetical protein LR48_Vigan569s000900 [Vigna angularis]|uniref:Uncharacterized protein n=1 Tax=Phaseolus angularis TaxID=3914 RepID=A0A0L9TDZ2_PHAAN|nr:hypothetical protein LR48_Vigan569s000900 [Vigna angularis]
MRRQQEFKLHHPPFSSWFPSSSNISGCSRPPPKLGTSLRFSTPNSPLCLTSKLSKRNDKNSDLPLAHGLFSKLRTRMVSSSLLHTQNFSLLPSSHQKSEPHLAHGSSLLCF